MMACQMVDFTTNCVCIWNIKQLQWNSPHSYKEWKIKESDDVMQGVVISIIYSKLIIQKEAGPMAQSVTISTLTT